MYKRPHVNADLTVAELIAILEKCPKDLHVAVYEPSSGEYVDIEEIDIEYTQLVIQVVGVKS